MSVFAGRYIGVEFGTQTSYKTKRQLRQLITDHDGIVSFVITRRCNVLVTSKDADRAKDSFKCRSALKYKIPVVSVDFLNECVKEGRWVDPEPFYVLGETRSQLLHRGLISSSKPQKPVAKSKLKRNTQPNLKTVKHWTDTDQDAPQFTADDECEIAKAFVLKKQNKNEFCVVELHVATSDVVKSSYGYHCGVSVHVMDLTVSPAKSKTELRCGATVDDGVAIYARLVQLYTDPPNNFVRAARPYPACIGSAKFKKMYMSDVDIVDAEVDASVIELVDHIWAEATGHLDDVLSVPARNITLEQVEKAESVLLEIKRLIDGQIDTSSEKFEREVKNLSDEFHTHLPHDNKHCVVIDSKRLIANKQQLCQLISDMVSVSESTGWSRQCPTMSKYRALRCKLVPVTPDMQNDYDTVMNIMRCETIANVVNIYQVSRAVENINFRSDVGNVRLLSHASSAENFVGILSRGLLLPKVVVDDIGGTRTDAGMLGYGIYFADSASTSVEYSRTSSYKGTRLMALCDVALGQCHDTFRYDVTLTRPPDDYDSVHGVKCSEDVLSDFKDDEYAVYNTDRQCIRYLVEFTVHGDLPLTERVISDVATTEIETSSTESKQKVTLEDVENVSDPLQSVQPGLMSSTDVCLPLKSVHVRAKLVDLAAQVIVLQEYRNNSSAAIEAKYVFPLDEMSVVCGFEAFINGKHVVGVVKEKETAHREYRQAVEAGHGAYLMDQEKEQPDVFTVSVGNLPPHCTAVIKITYVAELVVDGDHIRFRVPGSVAPWTQKSALDLETQATVETVRVGDGGSVSVQVAVEMPFDIRSITSPTHSVRIKKTATKAVVEMAGNQTIQDGGFQLLILLAELHVPRMWVEQHPDDPDSRACMLAFYPEFESTSDSEGHTSDFEVTFVLDLSNSMSGSALQDAKKVLLLVLRHLPSACFFNVVVFGTYFNELFPSGRRKSAANETAAINFIQSCQATLGNSDLHRPLRSCQLVSRGSESCDPLNVFVVSDGHWTDTSSLMSSAQVHSDSTRIFTLGVGDTANRYALRSLARCGAGSFEFFDRKAKSKWEGKVKGQLEKAAQPSLTCIEVEWQQFNEADDGSSPKPTQAPANVMALFSGCRQVVYGFVPNCTQATLKAAVGNQQVSTLVSTSELSITTGQILHRLTARAVIDDWQHGLLSDSSLDQHIAKKNRKNYVIKLSTDFSIVTEFTSFVAIEKRDEFEKPVDVTDTEAVKKLIDDSSVDFLNYVDWDKKLQAEHKELMPLDEEDISDDISDIAEEFEDMSCEEYVEKQLASLQDKVNKTQKSSPLLQKEVISDDKWFYCVNSSSESSSSESSSSESEHDVGSLRAEICIRGVGADRRSVRSADRRSLSPLIGYCPNVDLVVDCRSRKDADVHLEEVDEASVELHEDMDWNLSTTYVHPADEGPLTAAVGKAKPLHRVRRAFKASSLRPQSEVAVLAGKSQSEFVHAQSMQMSGFVDEHHELLGLTSRDTMLDAASDDESLSSEASHIAILPPSPLAHRSLHHPVLASRRRDHGTLSQATVEAQHLATPPPPPPPSRSAPLPPVEHLFNAKMLASRRRGQVDQTLSQATVYARQSAPPPPPPSVGASVPPPLSVPAAADFVHHVSLPQSRALPVPQRRSHGGRGTSQPVMDTQMLDTTVALELEESLALPTSETAAEFEGSIAAHFVETDSISTDRTSVHGVRPCMSRRPVAATEVDELERTREQACLIREEELCLMKSMPKRSFRETAAGLGGSVADRYVETGSRLTDVRSGFRSQSPPASSATKQLCEVADEDESAEILAKVGVQEIGVGGLKEPLHFKRLSKDSGNRYKMFRYKARDEKESAAIAKDTSRYHHAAAVSETTADIIPLNAESETLTKINKEVPDSAMSYAGAGFGFSTAMPIGFSTATASASAGFMPQRQLVGFQGASVASEFSAAASRDEMVPSAVLPDLPRDDMRATRPLARRHGMKAAKKSVLSELTSKASLGEIVVHGESSVVGESSATASVDETFLPTAAPSVAMRDAPGTTSRFDGVVMNRRKMSATAEATAGETVVCRASFGDRAAGVSSVRSEVNGYSADGGDFAFKPQFNAALAYTMASSAPSALRLSPVVSCTSGEIGDNQPRPSATVARGLLCRENFASANARYGGSSIARATIKCSLPLFSTEMLQHSEDISSWPSYDDLPDKRPSSLSVPEDRMKSDQLSTSDDADDRVRTFPIDEYICRGVSRPLTLISPLPPEHVNRLIELVSLEADAELGCTYAYWRLMPNVCDLIGVQYHVINDLLDKAGIKSLGMKASRDVFHLVATLMVLFRVFGWTRRSTFAKSSLLSVLRSVAEKTGAFSSGKYNSVTAAAARYCIQVDEKRPLVYSALQLGRSWDDAICSLLGDVEVKPLTTPPPQFGLPVVVTA